MTEDTDWECVAKGYQSENENLRIELLKYKKRDFSINIDTLKIERFVERHYMLVILSIFMLSNIASFLLEVFEKMKGSNSEG